MTASGRYSKVFEPGYIGAVRTKNRLVKTGSHLGFFPYTASIDDDAYIEGLRDVAQAIHAHDCQPFMHVFHMGPMHPEIVSGHQPMAASSLAKRQSPRPQLFVARELTFPEIEALVHKFVGTAVRAQKAGFEGVEVDAACKHLLNSFLSRAWNKRPGGLPGH